MPPRRDGRYYLYFPARTPRAGSASARRSARGRRPVRAPAGADQGRVLIDPAVFEDEDGSHYLYFGGIWGGQLQKYRDNQYSEAHEEPGRAPALGPRVGRLDACMTELAEPTREVQILDEHGQPLRADDHARRFFEGPWLHRYQVATICRTHWQHPSAVLRHRRQPVWPVHLRWRDPHPVVGWTTHHPSASSKGSGTCSITMH